MAVSRELIINSTDSNDNDISTTIKNINPDETVTNAQLKIAAQNLNSLTTNSLVSIYVVNTEDITSAT